MLPAVPAGHAVYPGRPGRSAALGSQPAGFVIARRRRFRPRPAPPLPARPRLPAVPSRSPGTRSGGAPARSGRRLDAGEPQGPTSKEDGTLCLPAQAFW